MSHGSKAARSAALASWKRLRLSMRRREAPARSPRTSVPFRLGSCLSNSLPLERAIRKDSEVVGLELFPPPL
jgi:hypothetical protein